MYSNIRVSFRETVPLKVEICLGPVLLEVDGAGDGDCIAVLRQHGDMRRPVILRRVEDGSVMARIVHGHVVVNFAVAIAGPLLASDVFH